MSSLTTELNAKLEELLEASTPEEIVTILADAGSTMVKTDQNNQNRRSSDEE